MTNRGRATGGCSRKELASELKKVAKKLGRAPTQPEFIRAVGISERRFYELFEGYRECLRVAGLDARGPGYTLTTDQLLEDWAAVARKLKRIPTVVEYEREGKYSQSAFVGRWGSWYQVPAAAAVFAGRQRGREWQQVRRLARDHVRQRPEKAPPRAILTSTRAALARRVLPGPVYGRPIQGQAMANAPTNEMGVMFLFASLAKELGFSILRVQPAFPDCEALWLCRDGRWRRVRIEFEFESRNFVSHRHDKDGCDLIVCWKHNWPGCPVEVIELSKLC